MEGRPKQEWFDENMQRVHPEPEAFVRPHHSPGQESLEVGLERPEESDPRLRGTVLNIFRGFRVWELVRCLGVLEIVAKGWGTQFVPRLGCPLS